MKLAISLLVSGIGMMIVGAILIVFAAERGGSSTVLSITASSFDQTLDTEEQKFLELINQYRQEQGLATLVARSELNAAAFWKSRDMALENYFSHTDSQGRDPFQLMSEFGYPRYGCWKGENLVAGPGVSGAEYALLLWKDSPGHNANMLNPGFTEIGISRFADPESFYGWYWATEFGGCSN